ncbi:MAG TPA: ferredoxin [Acidimicrobiales bacterium]|nr:ferredoxin [Acidimicrobiales bacterium]
MPKLKIDLDACIGSGSCVYEAPDVFTLDDDGMPEGPDEVAEVTPQLQAAIDICPTKAISVVD